MSCWRNTQQPDHAGSMMAQHVRFRIAG